MPSEETTHYGDNTPLDCDMTPQNNGIILQSNSQSLLPGSEREPVASQGNVSLDVDDILLDEGKTLHTFLCNSKFRDFFGYIMFCRVILIIVIDNYNFK